MIGVAFASASTERHRRSRMHQLTRFAELFQDVLHAGGFRAVIPFDPVLDLLGRRNDDLDVFAERKAQIFRDTESNGSTSATRSELSVISIGSAPCNRARPVGMSRKTSGAISRSVKSRNSVPKAISTEFLDLTEREIAPGGFDDSFPQGWRACTAPCQLARENHPGRADRSARYTDD